MHVANNAQAQPYDSNGPEASHLRSSQGDVSRRLRRKHDSTMSITSRMRKVPSVFSKDKSVQFAQENTILVIDDENQLLANG